MHTPRLSTALATALLCALSMLFGCDLARVNASAQEAAEVARNGLAIAKLEAEHHRRPDLVLARGGFKAGTTSTGSLGVTTGPAASPFGHYLDVPTSLEVFASGGPIATFADGVVTIHGRLVVDDGIEAGDRILVRGQQAIAMHSMVVELAPWAFGGGLLGALLVFGVVSTVRSVAYRAYLARQAERTGPEGGAFRSGDVRALVGVGRGPEDPEPVRRVVVAEPRPPRGPAGVSPPPTSTPGPGRTHQE